MSAENSTVPDDPFWFRRTLTGRTYHAVWYLNRQFTKTLLAYGRVKEDLLRRGLGPSDEEIGSP